jgi:DNA-directed RNA polymerase specialized sigma24 family protein
VGAQTCYQGKKPIPKRGARQDGTKLRKTGGRASAKSSLHLKKEGRAISKEPSRNRTKVLCAQFVKGFQVGLYHGRLYRLVEELPAVQRRVISERFVEQRTIREIAGQLKKTEGAIKQLQFRAQQTLRVQLERGHA